MRAEILRCQLNDLFQAQRCGFWWQPVLAWLSRQKRPVIPATITINLTDTIIRTTGIGTITDPIFTGMGTGIIPISGRADTIVRLQASIHRAITSR
ncbi:MAG: hypothetical protein ACREX9_12535 [Gammaproteobacteria bacterium]